MKCAGGWKRQNKNIKCDALKKGSRSPIVWNGFPFTLERLPMSGDHSSGSRPSIRRTTPLCAKEAGRFCMPLTVLP